MAILDRIYESKDVKQLNIEQLEQLAEEIREEITRTVTLNGGHLASNLGVVELTLALHYVFDLPEDKIVWDVGHQCYAHKLITGRKDRFHTIRRHGGISGFPKREESPCDSFGTGHSSTSISAALGMTRARDLRGEDHHVVAVIGDGSLSGGEAFEAMNDLGQSNTRMIIILNDNNMSISPNIGGVYRHLDTLRSRRQYMSFKKGFEHFLHNIPWMGKGLVKFFRGVKNKLRMLLLGATVFDRFGLRYIGPKDGHNLKDLINVLANLKEEEDPVVLHVLTCKGKGNEAAEEDPEKYHGVPVSGKTKKDKDFTKAFSDKLVEMAEEHEDIVAVTAAMPVGTGLVPFGRKYPERLFDVGIAEQHAVTLAAGLAVGGEKPVVAIYSTFLQRAYDQVVHDVCIQDLPVIFAVNRAGLNGEDGETHHGMFDVSFLNGIPNMHIFAPYDEEELRDMMELAYRLDRPCAIRLPKGSAVKENIKYTPYRWSCLRQGENGVILSYGVMLDVALQAAERLSEAGIQVAVYNAGTIKPMDTETLEKLKAFSHIYTLEDGVLTGGLGQSVNQYLSTCAYQGEVACYGIEDVFVKHGSTAQLRTELGLDAEQIAGRIKEHYGKTGQ